MDGDIQELLTDFVRKSRFADCGGVVTDLDGTAVHESEGRIYIPPPVELGLKAVYQLGRPVVLNSLRFPLSVLRTFGKEWYALTSAPIPLVSLNGSLLGHVAKIKDELVFEEFTAFPLQAPEIDDALQLVERLVHDGIKECLLFYYPRDWRMGEIIWTPLVDKVLHVKEKYTSASAVTAVELPKLREQLHGEDICMIFVLIETDQDRLMAYQHTSRSNFFTRPGVNKLSGSMAMAEMLKLSLGDFVGAGDTPMDRFLEGVGLAVIVGTLEVPYRGLQATVRIKSVFELGEILFQIAELQREFAR